MCREINPNMNGFVTVVEIDDILRILYPQELEDKDLSDLYEPYCSIQNKILINYKALRDMLQTKMREIVTSLTTSQLKLIRRIRNWKGPSTTLPTALRVSSR